MKRQPIMVIGGGAVAMSFALAAAQDGHNIHLFSHPGERNGGRRYALGRRGLNFLHRLGVTCPARPVRYFHLVAGRRRLSIPATATAPVCHTVAETELLAALTERLAAAGVTAQHSKKITPGNVSGKHIHASVDGQTVTAALLVIADGAHSPTAIQMGNFAEVINFTQQAVTTDVNAPVLAADAAYQWFDDHETIALLPAGGFFSLIWSTTTAPDNAAALPAVLQQRTGIENISLVNPAAALRTFPLQARRRAARTAPRTAFIGDCARTIHPMAGQGLNLGLADAECLVRCLRRRLDIGGSGGLSAYAAARAAPADRLHALTAFLQPSQRRATAALTIGCLPGIKTAVRIAANL